MRNSIRVWGNLECEKGGRGGFLKATYQTFFFLYNTRYSYVRSPFQTASAVYTRCGDSSPQNKVNRKNLRCDRPILSWQQRQEHIYIYIYINHGASVSKQQTKPVQYDSPPGVSRDRLAPKTEKPSPNAKPDFVRLRRGRAKPRDCSPTSDKTRSYPRIFWGQIKYTPIYTYSSRKNNEVPLKQLTCEKKRIGMKHDADAQFKKKYLTKSCLSVKVNLKKKISRRGKNKQQWRRWNSLKKKLWYFALIPY